jgi:hypothetical protein
VIQQGHASQASQAKFQVIIVHAIHMLDKEITILVDAAMVEGAVATMLDAYTMKLVVHYQEDTKVIGGAIVMPMPTTNSIIKQQQQPNGPTQGSTQTCYNLRSSNPEAHVNETIPCADNDLSPSPVEAEDDGHFLDVGYFKVDDHFTNEDPECFLNATHEWEPEYYEQSVPSSVCPPTRDGIDLVPQTIAVAKYVHLKQGQFFV